MKPEIEVTGVEEVNAALNALGKAIVNDLQPAAQVAALGAAGASQRAPVITGELASGYGVQDRFVINDVSYASFVEFGTRFMEGQFPIQQSLDAISSEAEQIYNDWAKQQIEAVGFDATG